MTRQEEMKQHVAEAWRNANEGGYDFAGYSLEEIACDMIAYDDRISNMAQDDADDEELTFEIVAILPEVTGRTE